MATRKVKQHELVFNTWGGKRKGSGRKPKGEKPMHEHATRPKRSRHQPVHITMHLRENLPSLRDEATRELLERAFFTGRERFGFRLVEYSIQTNHLHVIAEVEDKRALTRGMQGLTIRVAK